MPIIVLEGANGTGTSTQCNKLKEYLEKAGKTVYLTRHPGSTELGQQLRKILKFGDVETTAQQELLMFAADAMAFYQHYIQNMNDDDWVICDRLNITGALTYQRAGGAKLDQIHAMINILRNMGWTRVIDYLFIFNAPYEKLIKRLENPDLIDLDKEEGNKKDRFESRGDSFMKNVCHNYQLLLLDISEYEKSNDCAIFRSINDINASESIENVFEQIIDRITI